MLTSKMLKKYLDGLQRTMIFGKGLLRGRFMMGRCSESSFPKLPYDKSNTYTFSPIHLINTLLM